MMRYLLPAALLLATVPAYTQAQGRPAMSPQLQRTAKTLPELKTLAMTGVNLVIDAATLGTLPERAATELADIVGAKGAHLTITNAQFLPNTYLLALVKKYPHTTTFDFR